jgi:hypothetical protein
MKRLIGCCAVAVLLLVGTTVGAFGARHRNVDNDIKATRASGIDRQINDAVARAAKLLSEIDPAEDAEAFWRASATLVW